MTLSSFLLTYHPPCATVYHLGLFREKVSLAAVEYYSRLPSQVTVDALYILDPLIATGGTAIAACHMIQEWGLEMKNVKLLSVLGSKEGLDNIQKAFPELDVSNSSREPLQWSAIRLRG